MENLNKYGEINDCGCPRCGNAIKPEWKVCPNCAERLVSESVSCAKCGTPMQKDWRACPRCGTLDSSKDVQHVLLDAVAQCDFGKAQSALDAGAQIDPSWLASVAFSNNESAIIWLIDKGVNVNATHNWNGYTPLHYAVGRTQSCYKGGKRKALNLMKQFTTVRLKFGQSADQPCKHCLTSML